MKQLLFSFIIFLSLSVASLAQSFTVEYDSLEIIGSTNPIYTYLGTITNNSADTLFVRMTMIPQDMPSEWELGMCTINGCLPPGVTVDSFYVAPGQSEIAWVEFFTNNVSGDGSMIVLFENRNDENDFVEVTLAVEAIITEITKLKDVDFNISQNYPNPFYQSTSIDYELKNGKGVLFIHDNSGRTIQSFQIEQSGKLSLGEELQAGIYIYTFLQDGKTYPIGKMVRSH